jgi:hypothetical protein
METELTTLIAKPRGWQRWTRWPGAAMVAVGLWSLAYDWEPAALVLVAVGLWCTAEFWRGVRVTGDTLIAQGRVVRRTLPLTEFRQVGVGPMGAPWVQPREGTTLVLHMAETRIDERGSVADIHDRLRELAAEAGADLEPPLEDEQRPPRPSTPFYGW